jgi:hypothetical protein
MALARATAIELETDEYEVRIGVEWAGTDPLNFHVSDRRGFSIETAPLIRFTSITSTVLARAAHDDFRAQVCEVGLDCINQAGIQQTTLLAPPHTE